MLIGRMWLCFGLLSQLMQLPLAGDDLNPATWYVCEPIFPDIVSGEVYLGRPCYLVEDELFIPPMESVITAKESTNEIE